MFVLRRGLLAVLVLLASCTSEAEPSASSAVEATTTTAAPTSTSTTTAAPTSSTTATTAPVDELEDQGVELASMVLGEGEILVLARGDDVEIHRDGGREIVAHAVANPSIHEPTGNGWMYAEGAFISAADDSVRCDYPATIESEGVVANVIDMRDGVWFAQIEQISTPGSFMVDCRSGEIVDEVPFFVLDPNREAGWVRTIERGGTELLVLGDAEGNEQISRIDGTLVSNDTTFGAVLDTSGAFVAYADYTFDDDGPREGVVSAFETSRVVIREIETGDVVAEVVLPSTVLTPLFFNDRFVVTEIGISPNAPGQAGQGYQVAAIELETGTVSIFDSMGVPILLGDPPALAG